MAIIFQIQKGYDSRWVVSLCHPYERHTLLHNGLKTYLLVEAAGAVRIANIAVGPAHSGLVVHSPGQVEVRLVQLEGSIVVAKQLVDDAQVGAGPALAHPVLGDQGHLQLLLVPFLGLRLVAHAAGSVAQARISPGLDGLVVERVG